MKESLLTKLEYLSDRLQEIEALLADPSVINDQNRFRDLSKEHAEVRPVVDCFKNYRNNLENIRERQSLCGFSCRVKRPYCAVYNLTQRPFVAPFVILTLRGLIVESKEGNDEGVHHGATIQAGVFTIHL